MDARACEGRDLIAVEAPVLMVRGNCTQNSELEIVPVSNQLRFGVFL